MKQQIYEIQEQLKYCSPLGALLHEMRRVSSLEKPKVGIQSIRKLEEAGIEGFKDLVALHVEDLIELGMNKRIATQIRGYIQRRVM